VPTTNLLCCATLSRLDQPCTCMVAHSSTTYYMQLQDWSNQMNECDQRMASC
jgi:hypothetical protein